VGQRNLLNPKELEGKRVAVSRLGSDSHRYGVLMLENSGVEAKKVTFIQTGSTTVSLAALQQGSVEAAVLSPPFTGAMVREGYTILARSRTLVESPWLGLVTSRQKLQKRPDQVRTMLSAMREVLASIRQDKRGVTAYIRDNFKVSQEVAEESYEDLNGVIIDDLMMPESRIKTYLESAYSRGEFQKLIPVSEAFDFSLLKNLK
jgi:ABC-type nitrate/sulfonate/bicarbonate transport system substrate-binding protein